MEQTTKADLHVHSKYSKRPSQWVLQKIGCSESYTEPLHIYQTLRDKGMDLITITDHNTIEGSLEIAHLPDTFISEEITAYYPHDRCKVHVLAYNITEDQHREIQKYRDNVFELAEYLNQADILHALAHPLFSVNDKLTTAHFEQLLLLFKIFEINGARDEHLNTNLQKILATLTPVDIRRLENIHDRAALIKEPWIKHLTGGSDDHSSLNIARTHTVMTGKHNLSGFLQGIREGQSSFVGRSSSPQTLAHNLYSIAYQFYKEKFQLGKHVNKDILLKFIDRNLDPGHKDETGLLGSLHALWSQRLRPRIGGTSWRNPPEQLQDLLRHETAKLIWNDPKLMDIVRSGDSSQEGQDKAWFAFVNRSANKVLKHSADHMLRKISQGSIFDIFHSLGSAGALYTLLMPYFLSYSLFAHDRKFSGDVRKAFAATKNLPLTDADSGPRVAHFTDTFYEVNGVALTLQQQLSMARSSSKNMTIITCAPDEAVPSADGVRNFAPIGVFELPEYPELKLFYPPLLEMMHFCFENQINHIHTATPGPIGLAALALAKLMHLPIYGTYHTSLPQYTQYLTQDSAMEELMWRFTLWYYDQMDLVFAPSHATANELIAKGLRPDKVQVYPRGIDIDRFHPSKRNGFYAKRHQLRDEIKLLYVGRVSKEKNLHILEEAYRRLQGEGRDVRLIVVGDGPYREQMERNLSGTQTIFTGYLDGDALAEAYASADIFVFPSTTDTFGNVVLEALASGLPVIVSAEGGPQENVIHDQTGIIVPTSTPQAYHQALANLLDNPPLLKTMSSQARNSMESRSFGASFDQVWSYYGQTG
ncbi:glycosyltransferase [Desulfonatronum thioautotrophicum]|uniref:glycosyltransferase n=1 Tax=Desulfonatronum thioautotrophicum TaxID=617001 RepID=UPI0005EB1B56|nr:glycosyltransferase [Desulfonatronum thioautotrophicum]